MGIVFTFRTFAPKIKMIPPFSSPVLKPRLAAYSYYQFDQKNVGGDLIEEKDLFFGLKIHLQEGMMTKFQVPHLTACRYYYYTCVIHPTLFFREGEKNLGFF